MERGGAVLDQEGCEIGLGQRNREGFVGSVEGYWRSKLCKGGGYLLQDLVKAKDEAITCKEDRVGGGFSSNYEYRGKYGDSYRYNSDSVWMLDSIGII